MSVIWGQMRSTKRLYNVYIRLNNIHRYTTAAHLMGTFGRNLSRLNEQDVEKRNCDRVIRWIQDG